MTTGKLLLFCSFMFMLTAPMQLVASTDATLQNTISVDFSAGTETAASNEFRPKKKKAKKKKAKRHCEAYESFM